MSATIDSPRHVGRIILITPTSGAFFDAYLDLLDSLAEAGLSDAFETGTVDLGLSRAQHAALRERGAHVVTADWPVTPPSRQNEPGHLAHVIKPFANRLFPGYARYLWMDADMWVQSPGFLDALELGVRTAGMAAPVECDPSYSRVSWEERQWLARRLARVYGLRVMLTTCHRPMLNTGMFMIDGAAPHWDRWQAETLRVVRVTDRAIASDQVALFGLVHHGGLPLQAVGAVHNWICSRAVPAWNPARKAFVTPDGNNREITVLHNTSPSRQRWIEVPATQGPGRRMHLHRPGGHVDRTMSPGPIADTAEPVALGSASGA